MGHDVDVADGERATMNRLDPRIQIVWAIQATLTAFVAGVVGLVAVQFLPVPNWTVGVVAAVVLAIGLALAFARYRRWGYEVREDSLYLERGVFTRVRTVVPYVRIQHVDSARGPVERLTGLASTIVYTAGSRGADVSIPGLTPDGSTDLQERLKRLAIRAEGEDAV